MELLILLLTAMGFVLFLDNRILAASLAGVVIVTAGISVLAHLRNRKGRRLAGALAKGFGIAMVILASAAMPGAIVACVLTSDPFCFLAAAPFLSAAAVTGIIAGIAHVVRILQDRRP